MLGHCGLFSETARGRKTIKPVPVYIFVHNIIIIILYIYIMYMYMYMSSFNCLLSIMYTPIKRLLYPIALFFGYMEPYMAGEPTPPSKNTFSSYPPVPACRAFEPWSSCSLGSRLLGSFYLQASYRASTLGV